jgi:enoyl-CoA hydratase/carnithine racemase
MAEDPVLREIRDGVAILTLNRPDRLNAWTGGMEVRYFDYMDECAADDAVKVIVVTGAGRGFCAGADMDMLAGIGDRGGEAEPGAAPRRDRPQWHTTTIAKPVIAAINGPCAGIGMVQALMCDVRFSAANAKYTTAFARRGLIAEHGLSWILPKLVGPAVALDLLMSGRTFLAAEAGEIGLVNKVVEGDVLEATLAYAKELATWSSPSSMAAMKRQVWDHYLLDLSAATEASNDLMRQSLRADDFREGVKSFVEKRAPEFTPLSKGWTAGA